MLRVAYLQNKRAATAQPPKDRELRILAKNTFLQLDILYEREFETCAEALFQAGQLWELEGNNAKATETYRRAVARAPDTDWAQKSKARLQELTATDAAAKQP